MYTCVKPTTYIRNILSYDQFLMKYKNKQFRARCSTVRLALQRLYQQCVSAVNDSEQ
jgi:hypothetical protein